jgi:hypothetical protein
MLFTTEREGLRAVFFRAWQHYREQRPLEGMEQVVVDVVLRHPEYHTMLEHPETYQGRDYAPELGETNPFLHMGLHIAVHEQLTIDRPAGVRAAHRALLVRYADAHMAEHCMMGCLAESLRRSQRDSTPPSEHDYLECIRRQGRND